MAKDDFSEFDNFEDDIDFDFEETNSSSDPWNLKTLAVNSAKVAWEDITGKDSNEKRTLKDTGAAFIDSLLGDELGALREIVDAAKESATEGIVKIKKDTNRLARDIGKLLPDDSVAAKFMEKLRRITSQDMDNITYQQAEASKEELRDKEIQDALAGLTKSAVSSEELNNARHEQTLGIQGGISKALTSINEYLYTANNSFQRKSLELQFRHWNTSKDQLYMLAALSSDLNNKLTAVIRNTSMSESVKIHNPETQEILAKVSPSTTETSILKKASTKEIVKNKVLKNIKGVRNTIVESIGAGSLGVDFLGGMVGQEGVSIPDMIGSMLAAEAKKRVGQNIAGRVAKTAIGKKLLYNVKSASIDPHGTFSDLADGYSRKTLLGSLAKKAFGTLRDLTYNPDAETSVKYGINNMTNPATYSVGSDTAIQKVIPGLLSKIYGEVKALRTRTTTPEEHEISYDHVTSTFKDNKQRLKTARENIKHTIKSRIRYDVDSFLYIVKDNLTTELTIKQLNELRQGVLTYIITTKNTNPRKLLEKNKSLIDYIKSPDLKKLVTTAIESMLSRAREDAEYLVDIHNSLTSIYENAPNLSAHVDELYRQGDITTLKKLGLIEESSLEDKKRGIAYKLNNKGAVNLAARYINDDITDTPEFKKGDKVTTDANGRIIENSTVDKDGNARELSETEKNVKNFVDKTKEKISTKINSTLDTTGSKLKDEWDNAEGTSFKDKVFSIFKTNKEKVIMTKEQALANIKSKKEEAVVWANRMWNMSPAERKIYAKEMYTQTKDKSILYAEKQVNKLNKVVTEAKDKAITEAKTFGQSVIDTADAEMDYAPKGSPEAIQRKSKIYTGMRKGAVYIGGDREDKLVNKWQTEQDYKAEQEVKTAYAKVRDEAPAAMDSLRKQYFEYKQTSGDAITSFKDYAATHGIEVEFSREGANKLVTEAKIKAKQQVDKLKDEATKRLTDRIKYGKLKKATPEELEILKTEFFSSREYQEEIVRADDFQDWIKVKGYTTARPLSEIFSLKNIFKKTREWDKKIAKAAFNGLGTAIFGKYGLFRGGYKVARAGVTYGIGAPLTLTGHAVDGVAGALGDGAVGLGKFALSPITVPAGWLFGKLTGKDSNLEDSPVGEQVEQATPGTTDKKQSYLSKIFDKTRQWDKKAASATPEVVGSAVGATAGASKGILGGLISGGATLAGHVAGGLFSVFTGNGSKKDETVLNRKAQEAKQRAEEIRTRAGNYEDRIAAEDQREKDRANKEVPLKKETKEDGGKSKLMKLLFMALPAVLAIKDTIANLFKPMEMLGKLGSALLTGKFTPGGIIAGMLGGASKVLKKILPGDVKASLGKIKTKVIQRIGPALAAKLFAKTAAYFVPGVNIALLLYTAYEVGKLMLADKKPVDSAVSESVLGMDVFDDSKPLVDNNGNPIKPVDDAKLTKPNDTNSSNSNMKTDDTSKGNGMWDNIVNKVKSGVVIGASSVSGFASKTFSVASDYAGRAGSAIGDAASTIGDYAGKALTNLKNWGSGVMSRTKESNGDYGNITREKGGYALGAYQFDTRTGKKLFLNYFNKEFPELEEIYKAGGLNNPAYAKKFSELNKTQPEKMRKLQEYLGNNPEFKGSLLNLVGKRMKLLGMDYDKSPTYREMLTAISNMHGNRGATNLITKSLGGAGAPDTVNGDDPKLIAAAKEFVKTHSEADIIKKIYMYRNKYISYFYKNENLAIVGTKSLAESQQRMAKRGMDDMATLLSKASTTPGVASTSNPSVTATGMPVATDKATAKGNNPTIAATTTTTPVNSITSKSETKEAPVTATKATTLTPKEVPTSEVSPVTREATPVVYKEKPKKDETSKEVTPPDSWVPVKKPSGSIGASQVVTVSGIDGITNILSESYKVQVKIATGIDNLLKQSVSPADRNMQPTQQPSANNQPPVNNTETLKTPNSGINLTRRTYSHRI